MQYELGEDRGVIVGREIFTYGAKDFGDKKILLYLKSPNYRDSLPIVRANIVQRQWYTSSRNP